MKIEDLPQGIHLDVPDDVYHAPVLGMVSVSTLMAFAGTASKYAAMIEGLIPRRETPAMSFGKALHMAVLEPDRFRNTYVIAPDFGDLRKTAHTSSEDAKANKTRRDEWRAAHVGAVMLEGKEGGRLLGMIARIIERRPSDPPVASLFEGGQQEVTVRWKDQRTGLECRARDDCWQSELATVIDLKSCQDASLAGFNREASNRNFHWIEAHYRAGHKAVGAELQEYFFVLQEKEPPYDFGVYTLPAKAVLLGIESRDRYMDRLCDCLSRDEWPGYSRDVVQGELQSWVKE